MSSSSNEVTFVLKVLTRLAKVRPNPISFCMDHGAYNSSCIGAIWAHEVLRGPRYRAFSGTTLGQHPGKEGYFQQVAISILSGRD